MTFHDDLRAQLTAEALRVVAPLAGTELRGGGAGEGPERRHREDRRPARRRCSRVARRASLQTAFGVALATLGERERGTARLEQAVAAFTEALKEGTRERVPLDWATTPNNLGATLAILGERSVGQRVLSRPWPPIPRRSRRAPASGSPSTGLRRSTTSTAPSRSCVSGAERFKAAIRQSWTRESARADGEVVRDVWIRHTLSTPF